MCEPMNTHSHPLFHSSNARIHLDLSVGNPKKELPPPASRLGSTFYRVGVWLRVGSDGRYKRQQIGVGCSTHGGLQEDGTAPGLKRCFGHDEDWLCPASSHGEPV